MQRNDDVIPRLSRGAGDGVSKMCAMNVISWQTGDSKITDYPACSARPLARIVQTLNDQLAGADEFLSPEDSVLVLDLAWQTVGTSGASQAVVWRWLAEMLGYDADPYADEHSDAYAFATAYANDLATERNDADIEFTRHAITRWRQLSGLDEPTNIDTAAVDSVLSRIG